MPAPRLKRMLDYPGVAINHEERLRKLETGVHPLRAVNGPEYDDAGPGLAGQIRWRVRRGLVMVEGVLTHNFASGTVGAQEQYGSDLPSEALPVQSITLLGFDETASPIVPTRVRFEADGDVILFNDRGGAGQHTIVVDGLHWVRG